MKSFIPNPFYSNAFSLILIGMVFHLSLGPSEAWIHMSNNRGYAPETMNPAYSMINLLPTGFKPQVTGMDTLSDGSLVLSTREDDPNTTQPPTSGKIFIVKGQHNYVGSSITYKSIAEGLFEPMGVAVVNDTIYTVTVKELIQFIDANRDGVYESRKVVCSGWPYGGNYFEWTFGLVYKDGSFYANLASHSTTDETNQSTERGSVIKMQTNNTFEILNTGIRRSNGIGLGPNNDVFITDNQGEWVPTNRLIHVQKDKWYGYHNGPNYNPKKFPLGKTAVWMEWWAVSRSPSQPTLITKGPYAGQMITGDCTDPVIRRVFLEKVGGEYQGAVFHWATMDKSPANRFLMAKNGDILVGGLGSFTQGHADWNWGGGVLYGLQVLRPTGVTPFDLLAVRAVKGGLDLEFTKPVGPEAENGNNYEVKTWGFISERRYDSPTQNEHSIYPSAIRLSPDRKRVFLAFGDLSAGNVVYLRLGSALKSESNDSPWITEAWYTLNNLGTDQPFQISTAAISNPGKIGPHLISKFIGLKVLEVTVQLECQKYGHLEVSVFGVKGNLIHHEQFIDSEKQLRMSRELIPAGIYSVHIMSKYRSQTIKVSIL
jgi:hypothetical protein